MSISDWFALLNCLAPEDQAQDRARGTYRYVRIVATLPAVWLLLAIAVVWVMRGVVFDSISDYYGGPLRDVFVGALMARGICMVAYKGQSKLEDYARHCCIEPSG